MENSNQKSFGKEDFPLFFYGTAWKELETKKLTQLALEQGFRAIDTANQRRHYFEEGVGDALREGFARKSFSREDLFLQTKYTFPMGQDHRLPYDPEAPIETQVRQSFESSLEHLGVATLDSYLLHGPSGRQGLQDADREAWRAMEALAQEGKTRWIGVSNVQADQLRELLEFAKVPPKFVQNRCRARLGWDKEVRQICREAGIEYQGFSLLTANRVELSSPVVQKLAQARACSIPQLVFAFARQEGMLSLTGTTSAAHMKEDLASLDLVLEDPDLKLLERLVT